MASDQITRTKVFISYSHQDARWLARLRTHLKPLERDLDIDIWDDTKINPGSEWQEDIRKAIASSKVAILLISANFLASDFIAANELPPLLEAAQKEGAVILPVILSPSRFKRVESLSKFQSVNDPSKPLSQTTKANQESIFVRVTEIIETTITKSPRQVLASFPNEGVIHPVLSHESNNSSSDVLKEDSQTSSEIVSNKSDTDRRRYMARAAHAIPHPSVVTEVANHLSNPNPEIQVIHELPAVLASFLGLRSTFMFRQNTTQTFRDAIEAALFHEIGHKSRPGEEGASVARLLILNSYPSPLHVGYLLYSDVEHPALKQMIHAVWPSEAINEEVLLSDLIFSGSDTSSTERIIKRFLSRMDNVPVSVIVLPHVVWINGATLDVKAICEELRAKHPLATIIVDGAQAVGHIPIDHIEQDYLENEGVDFYLGCGHKWLQGPETIGFARVGKRYKISCQQCRDFLTASDQLTNVSALGLDYAGQQIGTNQRGLGKGLLKAIRLLQEETDGSTNIYEAIRKNADNLRMIIKGSNHLVLLDPPSHMMSSIVSFTTRESNETLLSAFRRSLEREGFTPSVYPIPIHPNKDLIGRKFIRLSPGPDLTQDDFMRLATVVHEVHSNE